MSQTLSERIPVKKISAGNRTSVQSVTQATPDDNLELKTWLRIQEADARWQRIKEMILIGSAVFVILNACVASTYLLLSKASSPSDRLLAFYVLGQMMGILVGVVMSKNIKWRK